MPVGNTTLPKVSIIIPCWNRQNYIEDAIESALAQTYPNVEVVVIDDGSTDNSVEVIRRFGSKITFLCQTNGGVSSARNTGLKNSASDFVIFLDSDDWLSADIVEKHVEAALRWPEADVYGADTALVNEAGGVVVSAADWPDTPSTPLSELLLKPPLYFPSQMYRRSALERIGGLDETMRSHGDSDCLIRVALSGGKIVRSGGGYAVYRRTANSITQNNLNVHKYAVKFIQKLKGNYVSGNKELCELVDRRLLGIRLRYWNSVFAYHLTWKGLEPLKFTFHMFKVLRIDPGYIVFIANDRPWTLPQEVSF